jgi:hypothetical protein
VIAFAGDAKAKWVFQLEITLKSPAVSLDLPEPTGREQIKEETGALAVYNHYRFS